MTIITIIICLWTYHLCLIFICNAYTMFIDPMCLKTLHYFQLNIIYALLILIFLFLIVSYAYFLFNESLFCSLASIIPRMHSVPLTWCSLEIRIWKIIIMINDIQVDIASDVSICNIRLIAMTPFTLLVVSSALPWRLWCNYSNE